ncbi:hypothetical protein CB1_001241018 [Camelus ferus]|nr:hypothetical protein CB1_001241018 [Camelus ferus]
MALEVAAPHEEQLLLLFTAALRTGRKDTKPGGWPSAKTGVGFSSQKPSHQNALSSTGLLFWKLTISAYVGPFPTLDTFQSPPGTSHPAEDGTGLVQEAEEGRAAARSHRELRPRPWSRVPVAKTCFRTLEDGSPHIRMVSLAPSTVAVSSPHLALVVDRPPQPPSLCLCACGLLQLERACSGNDYSFGQPSLDEPQWFKPFPSPNGTVSLELQVPVMAFLMGHEFQHNSRPLWAA